MVDMHVAMAAEPMFVSSLAGYRQPSYEADDGELLERFRAHADRQAAGLLFDRHAPSMVQPDNRTFVRSGALDDRSL